jgi:hypothetical protein
MGLFNLFKSTEQKKQQAVINKLHQDIFPGGRKQREEEVQELRNLLNYKYSTEATEYTYVFAAISYYTSQNPTTNEIMDAVLRNSKSSVTKEDARKICLYVENKRHFKASTSLSDALNQQSDGDKLFMIAFGGIVEIKNQYKDLSHEGKVEVLLFNSLIALQQYQTLHPNKYEQVSAIFFKNLFKQLRTYNLNMNTDEMTNFVNNRFSLYLSELLSFYNDDENSYLLLTIYRLFYEKPSEANPGTSSDIFEYSTFLPALMQMRNYLIEKCNNIF